MPEPVHDPSSDEYEEAPLGAGLDLADPNSPLAPFFLSTSQVFLGLLLLTCFLFFNLVPLWHSDVWGHAKFGGWILDHQAFPDHEPFSPFTDKAQPLNHSGWLAQVSYASLYRLGDRLAGGSPLRRLAGGVELLRFAHQLMAFATLCVLALAYRRASQSIPLAVIGVLMFFALNLSLLSVQRPQAFGFVGFAAVLAMVVRPPSWRESLVLLPLLLVLWANLHGSFAMGLALIGVTMTGRAIEAGMQQGARLKAVFADPQVRRLTASLAIATVAIAVLNPHGPRLFLIVAAFGRHPNIPTANEWQPIRFSFGPGGHWAFGALVLTSVLTLAVSRRSFRPTEWLWLVIFGAGPLWQQRLFPWWAMLVPAVLLPHWKLIGERLGWQVFRFRSQPNLRKTIILAVVILPALMFTIPLQWLLNRGPARLDRTLSGATPWKLVAELTQPKLEPRPLPGFREELQKNYPNGKLVGPILVSETAGDFLYWAMPTENAPLAFSHIHLFPAAYWQQFLAAINWGEQWREFAERYGANLIVVEPRLHELLAHQLINDSEWLVFLDAQRADPRQQLLIALRRKPLLLPKP